MEVVSVRRLRRHSGWVLFSILGPAPPSCSRLPGWPAGGTNTTYREPRGGTQIGGDEHGDGSYMLQPAMI